MQYVFSRELICLTLVALGVTSSALAQNTGTGQNTGNTTQQGTQTGTTGMGAGINTELGALSQQIGTGFIGASTDTETFVGANQELRNTGQGNVRNFQNRNTAGNFSQQNQQRRVTTGVGVNAIVYRPQYRIAFDVPRPTSQSVNLKLGRSLAKFESRRIPFQGISFSIGDDQSVTLTGTVANEGEKQLAQLYFQMEPGIDKVVNQLVVEDSAAPASSQP